MKPVRVTTTVPYPREEVFDFLDVMSNHEQFTNHILKDWECSGPDRGIGSKARVHVTFGGRTDTVEIEVVSAERPASIVERNIGAGGKRVANGTYRLEQLANGGTEIEFEYAWQRAPVSERVLSAVVRATLRRANETAMQRLKERLAARATGEAPALSAS